jgi:hypothetical protein
VKILSILMLDPATAEPLTPARMEAMGKFIGEMKRKGALIDTGGADEDSLELKIVNKGGKRTVTDGPFSEAKEVVGGYALLDVTGREQAIEFTNQFLELVGEATCYLHEVSVV